jgi:membrane associated rhomboid family serine protease
MSYPVTNEQDYPRITPAVQALIAINVAVMFVAYTIWRLDDMAAVLAFRWSAIDEMRWHTALTYMFVHGGLWHLTMNMYSLFLFGPRLEHMWGTKRFVRFYLLAGLGGLLAHVLFVHNDATYLMGASAAIFGVMGAFALQWPRDE